MAWDLRTWGGMTFAGLGIVAGVVAIVAVATLPYRHSASKSKRTWRDALWWLVPLALLAIAAALVYSTGAYAYAYAHVRTLFAPPAPAAQTGGGAGGAPATCGAKPEATCGATDPVSDPAYNMKEIVKQSILLEEHLVEPNKRCKDCIVKHFLHIIALGQEAQMLAGAKTLPMLDSTPAFYEALYTQWLERKDDAKTMCGIEEKLRERRKELVAAYILN